MPYPRECLRWGTLGLAGLVAVAAPAFALGLPDLDALAGLERGRWQIKDAQGGGARSICLGDPVAFVQLEHGGVTCDQEVLASEARAATVQYSCPGRGY